MFLGVKCSNMVMRFADCVSVLGIFCGIKQHLAVVFRASFSSCLLVGRLINLVVSP